MAHQIPPDQLAEFDCFHRAELKNLIGHLCSVGFEHHIAQDAASEALIQLFVSWFSVRSNRRMWTRTVARRIAGRMARAERNGPLERLLAKGVRPQTEHDSGLGEVVERHGDLVGAVNSLPWKYRIPFVLHLENFAAKEIAEELDVSVRTVHRRIDQARDMLRAIIEAGEEN